MPRSRGSKAAALARKCLTSSKCRRMNCRQREIFPALAAEPFWRQHGRWPIARSIRSCGQWPMIGLIACYDCRLQSLYPILPQAVLSRLPQSRSFIAAASPCLCHEQTPDRSLQTRGGFAILRLMPPTSTALQWRVMLGVDLFDRGSPRQRQALGSR